MKIRFQADADLNEEIVSGLIRQEPSIDFQTAEEANLRGLSDEEVLEIASQENRILVTHDRRTMPYHFAKFIAKKNSPGVFIISQRLAIRSGIDELLLLWTASEMNEWENLIVDIPL
jgi:predicted nuclease of predicted toxin-antitoxin system